MTKKALATISFMVAITICLAIASCKKDDASNSSLIVGKWHRNTYIYWYNGYKDTSNFLANDGLFEIYTSDGKNYNYYQFGSDTSNYVINGNKIIFTQKNGTKDTGLIEILTATNLKLHFQWTPYDEHKISIYTKQ